MRATHGIFKGVYYYEVQILTGLDSDAHYRIGWATRQAELQAPVGFDKFGFAYRDIDGPSNKITYSYHLS